MAAFPVMRAGVLVIHEVGLLMELSPSRTGQLKRTHFALCVCHLESIETVEMLEEGESFVFVVLMEEEEETVLV